MTFGRAIVAPVMAIALVACSSGASASPPADTQLQVYAAASLRKALEAAKRAYEAASPGTTLTLSTDSSAALEAKIEQGAPADVFLSADVSNPQKLIDGGYAAGDVTAFAGNELVVIVPKDNPAAIAAPPDIAKAGVKVIAAADGVPVQRYTAQWLDTVRALPAYGADFPERYASNVASREDNVGGIVTKVALGEGDTGVVYVTDAASSGDVLPIEIPPAENVAATYGGVVVKASRHQDAANAFLTWLAGADGQAVLAELGFLPPPTP